MLASRLSDVTERSTELGAGQNDENLAVVEEAFGVLAQSDITEQVCDPVCVCVCVCFLSCICTIIVACLKHSMYVHAHQ